MLKTLMLVIFCLFSTILLQMELCLTINLFTKHVILQTAIFNFRTGWQIPKCFQDTHVPTNKEKPNNSIYRYQNEEQTDVLELKNKLRT